MKKISLFFLIFLSVFFTDTVFAALMGFYTGIGGGYGIVRTPSRNAFNGTAVSLSRNVFYRSGLSGRVFAGINFNRFFGIEGGYTEYARSRYLASLASGHYSSLRYYARAADVVGKFYLPIGFFNLYALAGGARYMERIQFANAGIPFVYNFAAPPTGRTNVHRTRPIVGVGISMDSIYRVTANIEATRILNSGNFATRFSAIPYADLFTVNVAYNFG